jgi:hypothetical protein
MSEHRSARLREVELADRLPSFVREQKAVPTKEREAERDLEILRTWGAAVLRPYAEKSKRAA